MADESAAAGAGGASQPPADGEENASLLDKMSSFASETGNKLAGSFKDATEDRQGVRVNEDAAVPVVRHPVRCFHAVLWIGLAVHPLAVIKPTKFASAFCIGTICSVAAKFMLNGPRTQLRLMVEWRKLPCSLALVASTLLTLCVLRARQLFPGGGRRRRLKYVHCAACSVTRRAGSPA